MIAVLTDQPWNLSGFIHHMKSSGHGSSFRDPGCRDSAIFSTWLPWVPISSWQSGEERMAHGKFYGLRLEVTHIISAHIPLKRISQMVIPNCKGDWEIECNYVSMKKRKPQIKQQAQCLCQSQGHQQQWTFQNSREPYRKNSGPSSHLHEASVCCMKETLYKACNNYC